MRYDGFIWSVIISKSFQFIRLYPSLALASLACCMSYTGCFDFILIDDSGRILLSFCFRALVGSVRLRWLKRQKLCPLRLRLCSRHWRTMLQTLSLFARSSFLGHGRRLDLHFARFSVANCSRHTPHACCRVCYVLVEL